MDPTQFFLEMNEAVNNGDLETARERALALRDWLDRSGFSPAGVHNVQLRSLLAKVIGQSTPLDDPGELPFHKRRASRDTRSALR